MNVYENKGFTLIELMIVIVIMLICGTTIYKIRSENSMFFKDNLFKRKAIWTLQSQADLIMRMPFDQIKVAENPLFSDEINNHAGLRDAKGSITVEEVLPELKKINLKITWPSPKQAERKLSLTIYRYRQ